MISDAQRAAHVDALFLDAVDRLAGTVEVDGLVLFHVGGEATRADKEEHQLVDRGLLGSDVVRGTLVRVHPVVNKRLQGDVRLQQRV